MNTDPHPPDTRPLTNSDVALFRRFHEAWTAGDLETVLDLVEPDVVVRPLHGLLFSRTEYEGRDGITDWYREMTSPWEHFEALVEDARPTSEGALGVLRVVGHRGEEALHARLGVACCVRNGRIASLTGRNAGDVEDELRAL